VTLGTVKKRTVKKHVTHTLGRGRPRTRESSRPCLRAGQPSGRTLPPPRQLTDTKGITAVTEPITRHTPSEEIMPKLRPPLERTRAFAASSRREGDETAGRTAHRAVG
jgi:hypothetical protein